MPVIVVDDTLNRHNNDLNLRKLFPEATVVVLNSFNGEDVDDIELEISAHKETTC